MLLHSEQGDTNECMYRATYALTHDPLWLELAQRGDPSSDSLWLARLAKRNILCYSHHVTQASYAGPCDRSFWTWFRGHTQDMQVEVGLLVTVWGHQLYHAVAVLLDTATGAVTISDSHAPGLLHFDWPDFLDSPYARAYRVEMLVDSRLPDP